MFERPGMMDVYLVAGEDDREGNEAAQKAGNWKN